MVAYITKCKRQPWYKWAHKFALEYALHSKYMYITHHTKYFTQKCHFETDLIAAQSNYILYIFQAINMTSLKECC